MTSHSWVRNRPARIGRPHGYRLRTVVWLTVRGPFVLDPRKHETLMKCVRHFRFARITKLIPYTEYNLATTYPAEKAIMLKVTTRQKQHPKQRPKKRTDKQKGTSQRKHTQARREPAPQSRATCSRRAPQKNRTARKEGIVPYAMRSRAGSYRSGVTTGPQTCLLNTRPKLPVVRPSEFGRPMRPPPPR